MAPKQQKYIIGRDLVASARLDGQHELWIKTFGWHLDPIIRQGTPHHGLQVADVATGTGLWAAEFANERPDCSVTGLDIDLSQCIPSEWLPQNAKIEKFDLLTEQMPEHLIEKFDIVHLRHFAIAIGDIDLIVKNLFKLLKPGGWLQWGEIDRSTPAIIKARADVTTSAYQKLLSMARAWAPKHAQGWISWAPMMRSKLEDHGLEIAHEIRARPPPWLRANMCSNAFMLHYELASKLDDENSARITELVREAEDEVMRQGKGYTLNADWLTVVAWKPKVPALEGSKRSLVVDSDEIKSNVGNVTGT